MKIHGPIINIVMGDFRPNFKKSQNDKSLKQKQAEGDFLGLNQSLSYPIYL